MERPDGADEIEVIESDRPIEADAASFQGRTGRRSVLIRIAAIAGAAGVLVLSAALTMAASPAPSASTGANGPAASTAPGASAAPGNGPWAGRGMMGGRSGGEWMRGGERGMRFGAITIEAINGSSLSLRTTDGWTRTVTVASSTKITKGGQTISLADLKVGDQVRFQETRNADGTYSITAIQVVLPHVDGTVGALTSNGFTVKAADGTTTTIVVTGTTIYRLGRTAGTRADVKVGDRVAVEGTKGSDGSITATSVQVAPAMVAGDVTAKTATTITIRLPGGTTTTIHVSGSTTYRVAGKTSATLADIGVGSRIVAQGTQNGDGSLQATNVASMPAGASWGAGGPGPGMHGPMAGPGTQAAPAFQG